LKIIKKKYVTLEEKLQVMEEEMERQHEMIKGAIIGPLAPVEAGGKKPTAAQPHKLPSLAPKEVNPKQQNEKTTTNSTTTNHK
jgi:hypothetical protein